MRIHSSAQEPSGVSLILSAKEVPERGSAGSSHPVHRVFNLWLTAVSLSTPSLPLPKGAAVSLPPSLGSLTARLPFDLLCFHIRKMPTVMRSPKTGRTTARATAEEESFSGDGAETETAEAQP